jgi:hypothetical protein
LIGLVFILTKLAFIGLTIVGSVVIIGILTLVGKYLNMREEKAKRKVTPKGQSK